MKAGLSLFRRIREAGGAVAFGCPDADGADPDLWAAAEEAGITTLSLLTEAGAVVAAAAHRRSGNPLGVVLGAPTTTMGFLQKSSSGAPVLAIATAPRATGADPGLLRVEDLAALDAALATAVRATGPVLVSIAPRVLAAGVEPGGAPDPAAPAGADRTALDEAAIDEAAHLLSLSARPVIWLGGGAAQAGEAVAEVAELLAAPIVTSTAGRGVLGDGHPLLVGSLAGASEVARLTGGADAGLAVGTSFSPRSTRNGQLPMPMQLFHVDTDPSVPGTRYPVRLGITGDAGHVLRALADRLRVHAADGAPRDLAAQEVSVGATRDAARARLAAAAPTALLDALRAAIPPEVPTVWDGPVARFAVPLFGVPERGTFHAAPPDSGAGWCIAASLGVATGSRKRAVAILDARGLVRRCYDLVALAQAGARVTVVALADDWAGTSAGSEAHHVLAARAPTPDLGGLGPAFGIPATVRAATLDALPDVLAEVPAEGPNLVVVG
ncbi:MAG TPA: thiamine pyrophosphate-binding protein [Actinomycetota bacterium]|nr:thiamine pyrophosphate-binding protein [Actinomycetota bacterium]